MTWACAKCTLVNPGGTNCAACGMERAGGGGGNKLLALLETPGKAIEKQLNNLSNALVDIFTPPSSSAHRPQPVFYHISAANSPRIPPPPPVRPPAPPRSSSSSRLLSSDWACGKCTFSNPQSYLACGACNATRAVAPPTSHSSTSLVDLTRDIDQPSSPSSHPLPSLDSRAMSRKDEEDAERLRDRIVQHCRTTKTCFIDDSFPHSNRSVGDLSRYGSDGINGVIAANEVYSWLRPQEIFTKDGRRYVWAVFRDPQPWDIEQGALGDCWLISAMALIAERPECLDAILLTKEYNREGVYVIRVCVDGVWRTVVVDDFFPCRSSNRALAFANGRKNQLWVPLIEKALAKALGSYERLRAGYLVEGLGMLTGAPCETLSINTADAGEFDVDERWLQLLSAKEAGFVMGASCGAGKSNMNKEEFTRVGLAASHAYSVLDVRQEGEHRLLRLRNPWGQFEWKGAWSDGWSGWTDELKARLLPYARRHTGGGAFWMSYDDFRKYFQCIDMAKMRAHLGWCELRIPIRVGGAWGKKDRAVRLVVERDTEVCLTLYQSGARAQVDPIDIMLCVHAVTPTGQVGELICRSQRAHKPSVTSGDVFLKPGQYVVVLHSLMHIGDKDGKRKACLAVHSARAVFGELVGCPAPMYTDSLMAMVQREGKTYASIEGVRPRYVMKGFAGCIVMVENHLPNQSVHVKIECSNSVNVVATRGHMDAADSVPPLSRQILIVLTHLEPAQMYSVHHRLHVRTSRRPGLGDWGPIVAGQTDGNVFHSPPFGDSTVKSLHAPRTMY